MSEPTNQDILNAIAGQNGRFDKLEKRFDTLEVRFDTLETMITAIGDTLVNSIAMMATHEDITKRLAQNTQEVISVVQLTEARLTKKINSVNVKLDKHIAADSKFKKGIRALAAA